METVSDRLKELYNLVDNIGVCMLTSRRPRDGRLVSRALCLGKRVTGCDMVMIISSQSKLCHDIQHDSHVNAAFYRDGTGEWVSVSGLATIKTLSNPTGLGTPPTPQDIHEFKQLVTNTWSNTIAAWFDDDIDPTTSSDIAVLVIRAISATYSTTISPLVSPRVLLDLTTAAITGRHVPTDQIRVRGLDSPELEAGRIMGSLLSTDTTNKSETDNTDHDQTHTQQRVEE